MTDDPTQKARAAQRRRIPRWAVVGGFLAVVLGIVLWLLPHAVAYGISRWFAAQGVESTQIEDVDFNLFTGRLTVQGLRAASAGRALVSAARSSLELDWLPLLHRELLIREVTIEGARLYVDRSEDGAVTLAGIALGPSARPVRRSDWTFTVNTWRVLDSALELRTPRLQTVLQARDCTLKGLSSFHANKEASLQLTGALGGAELTFEGSLAPFAERPRAAGRLRLVGLDLASLQDVLPKNGSALGGQMDIDTDVSLGALDAGALRIRQDGELTLHDLRIRIGRDVKLGGTRLAWSGALDGRIPARHRDAAHIDSTGALQGRGVAATLGPEIRLKQAGLSWEGRAQLSLIEEAFGGARIATEGTLRLAGLDLALAPGERRLQARAVRWTGRLGYGVEDVPTDLTMDGDLSLEHTRLQQSGDDPSVAAAKRMELSGLEAHGTHEVRVAQTTLGDLKVLGTADERTTVLAADAAQLEQVELTALNRLVVHEATLHAARLQLRRGPDGAWRWPPVRSPPSAGGGPRRTLRLDALNLAGTSRVEVEDRSVQPAFRTTVDVLDAELKDLDTAQPEAPSRVRVQAKIGKYSRLDAAGTIAPLAKPVRLDLEATVGDLDLPPLSPYAARAAGYNLTSGQMDGRLDLSIHGGALEGETHLALRNLDVAPADRARAEAFDAQLTMPLGTALDLLRDAENNIELSVPVSGDLSNPRFDLGEAVAQSLGTALRLAAVSYLKGALQPYGAVLILAELAGKAASSVRLQPVLFDPGTAGLDARARDYLARLARLMSERPRLQVRLCGMAVPGDRKAVRTRAAPAPSQRTPAAKAPITDEELLQLARRRAATVKDELVQTHEVAADRLFVCRPELDNAPAAEPRVQPLI